MSEFGWFAYAFAAEPFVVSAMATYVPIFLHGLAIENAVWAMDHLTPCNELNNIPGVLPNPIDPPKCVVQLLHFWIDTASLPLYTFSVSVIVQILLVISISGFADLGAHRKGLLVGFACLGSSATIAMGQIGVSHYYIAAGLAVIANASFGAVSVCGNAFLPSLVADRCASLFKLRSTAVDRFHNAFPRDSALSHISSEEKALISANISGRGTAIGYSAALFVQVITMLILVVDVPSDPAAKSRVQLVITFIGVWWLLGQIPVVLWLKDHSEELRAGQLCSFNNSRIETGAGDFDQTSLLYQLTYGWTNLFRTFRRARKLSDTLKFLLGWFLLSDSITTINSTAILFARTNLRMTTPALALIGLITVIFAITGSLVFARRKNQKTSLVVIALFGALIPAYGVLGFFQPWVGFKHAWEAYLLASWYGIALGALNTVTRSLFAILIPRGHEVMFFALYAVTDKGSSVLGPTVTGLITDFTHNICYAFYFLLGTMMMAALVFSYVDFEQGAIDAETIVQNENCASNSIDNYNRPSSLFN